MLFPGNTFEGVPTALKVNVACVALPTTSLAVADSLPKA